MLNVCEILPDSSAVEQTAIDVQQIPAPTFDERRRSDEVLRRFAAIGVADVEQDELGNVFGRRRGGSDKPGIMLAAHLDTVFPHGTELAIRRDGARLYGPGIGDNSLGVAALLHLAQALERANIANSVDIWYVADVGEEGLGDLRGMRAAVDRLQRQIGAVIAVEGAGLGRIYHCGIAVRRLRIEARAPGGHSWADHGAPSAVHMLVQIAAALLQLPLTADPKTTLNIGTIEGGTSVNSIAEETALLLDLRSAEQAALDTLAEAVNAMIGAFQPAEGASLSATLVGNREGGAIASTHPLAQAAIAALRAAGVEPTLGAGSTDANVPLARGIPAVCLGITHGGNAHRLDEYIDVSGIGRGMEALVRLVANLVVHEARSV